MSSYRVTTTTEATHPLRDPSVAAMREAYGVEVRAAHKDLASRKMLCRLMGWPEDRAEEDPLGKPEYMIAMARVLFPTASGEIGTEGAAVNVAEVIRGARDFFDALS